MLDLISHRAAGGTTRGVANHAVLGEARDGSDATDGTGLTSIGSLSIAADLRLWNRVGLRSRAGGQARTAGLDDRQLLLEAYRRTGIGFLDDVEGDFAFVIWDEQEGKALAVRDRFAVKPLHLEVTGTGIRFASEVKQLACTMDGSVEPSDRMIAELLVDRFSEMRHTFFRGIDRVRPSTALVADRNGHSEIRYWNPSPETVRRPSLKDVAGEFREQLVESVNQRLRSSGGVVSHLSGGLDSTSIAAAAAVSRSRGAESTPFHTVSAVFPGHTNDESVWIREIAARQPFLHHESALQVDDMRLYGEDMWVADTPWIQRMRGMWTFPTEVARKKDADLVLSGHGGDEVVNQGFLLADLLRAKSLGRWVGGSRSYAAWSSGSFSRTLTRSARFAVPRALKTAARERLPKQPRPRWSLIRGDLWRSVNAPPVETYRFDYGFPSLTQNAVVAGTQYPLLGHANDLMERQYAIGGLGLSHPFLDRSLVEYVASIAVADRPFDGRTKTLARSGFSADLPSSVLDRSVATYFDGYFKALFNAQAQAFRDRFPIVSKAAEVFIDPRRYRLALQQIGAGPLELQLVDGLWSAWTLMVWFDELGRYSSRAQ